MDSRTVSRRTVIHAAMRTGVYVAPAVLSVGMATRTAAVSAPTQTPLPLAPTRPAAPTSTTPPIGVATLAVVQAGMTADAPLNITGSGFSAGITLNIVFSSPSGTRLGGVQALTSATGTFRVLFDPSNLPIGMLTVKATDNQAPGVSPPVLATTMFMLTNNSPPTASISFTTGNQIIAGNMATVEANQTPVGTNIAFYVIAADGRTAATLSAMTVPFGPNSTIGTATVSFSTVGLPIGTLTVAFGYVGSSNLLGFTTGQIV